MKMADEYGARTFGGSRSSVPRINIRLREGTTKKYAPTEYTSRLDAKGRILIPQPIRDRLILDPQQPMRLWVNDHKGIYLELITLPEIQEFLRDYELSYEEAEHIWNYMYDYSKTIKHWTDVGYNWVDMDYPTLVSMLRRYIDLNTEGNVISGLRKAPRVRGGIQLRAGESNLNEPLKD